MVSLVRIAAPAASPVSLATAKLHLRVDSADDDDQIQQAIDTAVQTLDGPRGWLGRALITQTVEIRLDGFPSYPWAQSICLPLAPIQAVTSVKYDDGSGTEQILDPSAYRLLGPEQNRLALAPSNSWPAGCGAEESVRIRYTCGYGDAASDVPAPIVRALLMLVAQWNDKRSAILADNAIPYELPNGVQALLAPFRLY